MKHIGTQTIETPRLLLRRFAVDDADAVFKNWANDPAVTEFLCWPTHTSVEASKKVVEELWVSNYHMDNFYQWAIVLKELGEPIGSIGSVAHKDETQMVHIGYCIGKKWWHKGIMSEALAALIEYFFEKVGVNRIESRHDPNNPNSGEVMKKCGLIYEGTLRQADTNNKGLVDASMYAILREDYKK